MDAYAAIEQNRLKYLCLNQKNLHADIYQSLQDAIVAGDSSAVAIGQRIILPSSFIVGPHHMVQKYQDAMDDAQQSIKSLVGKPWSLVGIFDRSCLLFPRGDEKTLSVLPCLNRIFGSMLQFFIFISTCESWQPIPKSSESLPNGC